MSVRVLTSWRVLNFALFPCVFVFFFLFNRSVIDNDIIIYFVKNKNEFMQKKKTLQKHRVLYKMFGSTGPINLRKLYPFFFSFFFQILILNYIEIIVTGRMNNTLKSFKLQRSNQSRSESAQVGNSQACKYLTFLRGAEKYNFILDKSKIRY